MCAGWMVTGNIVTGLGENSNWKCFLDVIAGAGFVTRDIFKKFCLRQNSTCFYLILYLKLNHADKTKREGGEIFVGQMYVKTGVSVQKIDGTGKRRARLWIRVVMAGFCRRSLQR